MAKTHETSVFPRKNGGTVEVRLWRRSLFGLQNRLCGPPWCSPNSSQQYYFVNLAFKTALLCGRTALGANSLPLWCQNYGIIGFPAAKLTIPGGHDHTWAPIFRDCMTQNCNLDGIRGYLVMWSKLASWTTAVVLHRHVLCLGWRVGIVHSIVIVTATAAPDCDLTYLTYHTLPAHFQGFDSE